MKIRVTLFSLGLLLPAIASSAVRAEDFETGNMALAGSAASGSSPAAAVTGPATGGCCDNDPNKCCDCCGPGTNPWDGTVKVGFGLRESYNYVSAQAPTAAGAAPAINSNDYNFFNPDDARLYVSGTAFGGLVKGTFDTALSGGGSWIAPDDVTLVRLLDGIAQFEFNDYVNFWFGRFLPPTDRANLDGPFYQTPWDYPFVSNYPQIFDGRDDGCAYWGQAGKGKLKWQMGLFNGIRYYAVPGVPTNPNQDGNFLMIGRVTINLLDPEPGYYTQSCYFGDKEILAIGITGAFERDGAGNGTTNGDFTAGSIDLLWEHRLGNCGVINVEAAFYKYNYGVSGAEAAAGPGAGNVAAFDTAIINQGTAEYVEASYLLPYDICFGRLSGRLQPFTRYQYYNRDFRSTIAADGLASVAGLQFDAAIEQVDVGVNYVISGYNAKMTLAWEQGQGVGTTAANVTYDVLRVGAQLQVLVRELYSSTSGWIRLAQVLGPGEKPARVPGLTFFVPFDRATSHDPSVQSMLWLKATLA